MTPILDANVDALKTAYPELYKRIQPSLVGSLETDQPKEWIPERSIGFISGIDSAGVVVLCGFSNVGYAGSIVKTTAEDAFIIIVEKDLEVFLYTLAHCPAQDLILSTRVKLSVGEEDIPPIREHIENYSGFLLCSKILVVKDPDSVKLCEEYYENVERSTHELRGVASLNRRTIEYFSEEWNRHILMNLAHLFSCQGVSNLFGKFKGVPAVVVSAGPSLDKNIKWLKHIGSKAVIIAVDSAYKILINNDVPVHFVLCIDSQEKNFLHIEEVLKHPGETTLVVNPVTYPATPDLYNGNVLIMTYNNPLVNWIEEQVGAFGETLVGGSVSTSAFDFARKLGCSPVVIAGQDLSYESDRGYVTGTWYSSVFEQDIKHNNSLETLNLQYVSLNGTRKTTNRFGGGVRSNDEMLSWKSWYETVSSDGSTINSTEGGLSIDGFPCRPLHETAFRSFKREFPIGNMIKECLAGESSIRTASLLDGLRLYRESLSVVNEIAAKGLRCCSELSRILKSGNGLPGAVNIKLQALHTLCSSVLKEKTFIETNQWDINILLDRVAFKATAVRENPEERLDSYKLLFKGVSGISKIRARDLDAGLKKISATLDLKV